MATVSIPWLQNNSPTHLEYDNDDDYCANEDLYDYDDKLTQYLIALNDGMLVVKHRSIKKCITMTDRKNIDFVKYHIVRNTLDRRDQKFIARFLELLWTTNMTTANGVPST